MTKMRMLIPPLSLPLLTKSAKKTIPSLSLGVHSGLFWTDAVRYYKDTRGNRQRRDEHRLKTDRPSIFRVHFGLTRCATTKIHVRIANDATKITSSQT